MAVGDVNDDGWPDLYVANDFMERDYLYVNQGDGTFADDLKHAMPHISQFSMGSDIADLDHDGHLDVLVADMAAPENYRQKTMMKSMNVPRFRMQVRLGFHYQYSFNALHRNNGDGTFSDIAQLAGIARTDWSWAALAFDQDNDGYRDIYVTNGRSRESSNVDFVKKLGVEAKKGPLKRDTVLALLAQMPEGGIANKAFRNRGDLTFEDVSEPSGLGFVGASQGAAYGDLDGDGDLDLVVNHTNAPAHVYENALAEGAHHLTVRFEGMPGNPLGLGARVAIEGAGVAEHYLSRGYLSSVAPGLHFGLGPATEVADLTVTWPDGRRQVLRDVPADTPLTVRYADAGPPLPPSPPSPTLLEDVTERSGLSFTHQENAFDDLAREILLPYETSKLGPALAVGDVQGNGLDDVYVGGARGQGGALFVQQGSGRFVRQPGPWSAHADREDVAAAFVDVDGDGDLDLYVGSGGNEPAQDAPDLGDRLYVNDAGTYRDASDQLPPLRISTGVVAPGDVDGDGDADLFVGGRLVPGEYPSPPRSALLVNDGGRFTDATASRAPDLAQPGMVTDARFTDLDGDGDADLVFAGEWMAVTVATNHEGTLSAEPIAGSEGWWRSVVPLGELGGRGPWLLAGNVGLNLKFRATPEAPFGVYANDFDGSGSLDIVLSYQQDGTQFPVRGRECSSQQMPFIAEKFETYDDYGKATLSDVYGEGLDEALHLQARTFASSLLVREGEGWSRRALPNLAQIGAIQGAIPHDVNGDGQLDLIVAGNLEKTEVETPRLDGGTGLVLLGDGEGGFSAVPVPEAGFSARGDVKRLAKVRLANGGVGVVVARNDGPVSLFVVRGG